MAKVINFKSNKQKLNDWLAEVIQFCNDNEVGSFMVAGKKSDGEFLTGYFNMDCGEKQEAIAHVQIDVIDQVTRQNMHKYIEYVDG